MLNGTFCWFRNQDWHNITTKACLPPSGCGLLFDPFQRQFSLVYVFFQKKKYIHTHIYTHTYIYIYTYMCVYIYKHTRIQFAVFYFSKRREMCVFVLFQFFMYNYLHFVKCLIKYDPRICVFLYQSKIYTQVFILQK